ncbi:hypothetical protein Bbelb_380240, partial [Branchiostoma belcheri]
IQVIQSDWLHLYLSVWNRRPELRNSPQRQVLPTVQGRLSHKEASAACVFMGGQLVDIKQSHEQQMLTDIIRNTNDVSHWTFIKSETPTLLHIDGSPMSWKFTYAISSSIVWRRAAFGVRSPARSSRQTRLFRGPLVAFSRPFRPRPSFLQSSWMAEDMYGPFDICVLLDRDQSYKGDFHACTEQHNYVCESSVTPCHPDVCQHGGICKSCFSESPMCDCPPGNTGVFCETGAIVFPVRLTSFRWMTF